VRQCAAAVQSVRQSVWHVNAVRGAVCGSAAACAAVRQCAAVRAVVLVVRRAVCVYLCLIILLVAINYIKLNLSLVEFRV
jgi:hypothetical protein